MLYGRCEEQPVASYEPWIEALNLRSPFDLAPDRAMGDPEDTTSFFESVRARLCGASGRNRVFCVLEDVQSADRPACFCSGSCSDSRPTPKCSSR